MGCSLLQSSTLPSHLRLCPDKRPHVRGHRQNQARCLQPCRAIAEPAMTPLDMPEENIHPAYKKYRNLYEHNESELRQIERDEAHNVTLPRPTAFSLARYVLGCIKFVLIPRPIRYLWYQLWIRICSAYYPYRKALVLKGSELDYYLQQKARQEPHVRKAVALKRFHGRMGLWENTAYRSSLLKDAVWACIAKQPAKLEQNLGPT